MPRFYLCVLLLFVLAGPLAAEEAAPKIAAPAYPGLAEIVPRASTVTEEAERAAAKMAAAAETSPFEAQLKTARERQNVLSQRITALGPLEGWNVDRLLEFRGLVIEQREVVRKLLDGISARISELDRVRREWSQRWDFWTGWEESLQGQQLKIPKDSFRQARADIDGLLKKTAIQASPLVALQKDMTSLQEKNLDLLDRIDSNLKNLRQEIFKKTAPSFGNPDYYRQYGQDLWRAVKSGVAEVQHVRSDFVRSQGWVAILQGVLALALVGFILNKRHRAAVTKEWEFIIVHPWATGVFVAVSAFSILYTTPPTLWRLLLWVLAALSAAVLISGLLKNPRKIVMVRLLAFLFVLSLTLKIIALPQPLYRLYLAFVCLAGIPLLLVMAKRNLAVHNGKSDGFTLALRCGSVVLGGSLVAQFSGYSNLAARLFESSINTVFLGLFAAMAIRLGRGGIDYLISLEMLRGRRFFRRHGSEFGERLKWAFQVFVVNYSLLYLLEVWGIYDTVGQAWTDLLLFGFTLGGTFVSVQMVLLAGLVFYLSMVFSWLLSAFLDTNIFPDKGYDRGVRDAIKKLLHYALLLFGFLLAMSLAGVELKTFAFLAGALGIGIGFGLQDVVNNFVSGIILLFERPIKVGDLVVLDTEWGTVRKIGLRSTVIETLDQSEIIVPNSMLISEKVTNWTLSTKMARVVIPVGVAYGSDVSLVLSILSEVGNAHPDATQDPPPSPIFTRFGESSLDFELRVWIADISSRLRVTSELNQEIDRRFREAGVEIPFPQRDLHLRSVDPVVLARATTGTQVEGIEDTPE
jgi:small-conductance mechanosensitive channel